MTNNKMAEVAKLLGVDIGEEFELVGSHTLTRITTEGLEYRQCDTAWQKCPGVLMDLLTGKAKIRRKPWMPKNEEYYYTPTFEDSNMNALGNLWVGSEDDMAVYNSGLLCRTREEAEELHDDIVRYVRKLRGFDN